MAHAYEYRCRLCLISPPVGAPDEVGDLLRDAAQGGDIATLFVPRSADGAQAEAWERSVRALIAVARDHDIATIVEADLETARRVGADGIHGSAEADITRSGDLMSGVGEISSRHAAMTAGEAEPDYLFFGAFDGDRDPGVDARMLELAGWWSAVAVIPAVTMGGRTIDSVDEVAASGCEFVALRSAVWEDPRGPGAAVAEANARLLSLKDVA